MVNNYLRGPLFGNNLPYCVPVNSLGFPILSKYYNMAYIPNNTYKNGAKDILMLRWLFIDCPLHQS